MTKIKMFYAVSVAFGLVSLAAACDALAVNWQNDFDGALKDAGTRGVPVVVDFYTDWCEWCKRLDKDTYANSAVDELSRRFVCVKVDADKNRALVGKYGVNGFPTVIFMDRTGNVIDTFVGYAGPDRFIALMNNALSKAGGPQAGAGVPQAAGPSVFRLEGVVATKNGLAAIINGKMVRVGDSIDDAAVIEINKNRAKLRSGGGEVILEI